jgi:prolyl 4-hydroxylase
VIIIIIVIIIIFRSWHRVIMHASPSSSSMSIGSIIQYVFLAAIAYVLAGAPLLSLLTAPSSSSIASQNGNVLDVSKLDSLVIPEANLSCEAHAYKGVYVLSREPLVVYIEGFLGEKEGEEVVKIRYIWRNNVMVCL